MRITRDELGLSLAKTWALRGTCARRQVGCALFDINGQELETGYNGPPSGEPHCTGAPCPGAGLASGTGLSTCEAIHAEANALLKCSDVYKIHAAFVTVSPCVDCVKLLMNTSCVRIVFLGPYAHDAEARKRWVRSSPRGTTTRRTWEQGVLADPVSTLFASIAHGDQAHRDWLKEAIADHFAGRPVRRPS